MVYLPNSNDMHNQNHKSWSVCMLVYHSSDLPCVLLGTGVPKLLHARTPQLQQVPIAEWLKNAHNALTTCYELFFENLNLNEFNSRFWHFYIHNVC